MKMDIYKYFIQIIIINLLITITIIIIIKLIINYF